MPNGRSCEEKEMGRRRRSFQTATDAIPPQQKVVCGIVGAGKAPSLRLAAELQEESELVIPSFSAGSSFARHNKSFVSTDKTADLVGGRVGQLKKRASRKTHSWAQQTDITGSIEYKVQAGQVQ